MRSRQLIAVYIMASGRNGTLYAGVTSDLLRRVIEHKRGRYSGFSADHGCKTLVWFEVHAEMRTAIHREKRLKHWNRAWKLNLVEADNAEWRDLSDDWFDNSLPYLALKTDPGDIDLAAHLRDQSLAGR